MQKVMVVICALAGIAVFATMASSADDLAAAVKERRHLMKDIVRPAAKLGGDMVKGTVPFDAGKAAKAMTDINGNYRDFLTRQIVVEGAEKIAEGQKGKGKGAAKSAEKQAVAAGAPGAPTDILSRTAIKLQVK